MSTSCNNYYGFVFNVHYRECKRDDILSCRKIMRPSFFVSSSYIALYRVTVVVVEHGTYGIMDNMTAGHA